MNNVKNDERYFISDESKKNFSVKLNEEEFNELLTNSTNKMRRLEPVTKIEPVEEYLSQLIRVHQSIQNEIKKYIINCVGKHKKFDFTIIKKQLDEFEVQILHIEQEIEKRKAIILLQNEYDITKKIKPKI